MAAPAGRTFSLVFSAEPVRPILQAGFGAEEGKGREISGGRRVGSFGKAGRSEV